MGLLQALFDEVVSLPGGIKDTDFEQDRVTSHRVPVGYALVNGFFQSLDCLLMPLVVHYLWNSALPALLRWPLLILAAFSAGFSLLQALYYFIRPTHTYVGFQVRILGETAIGQLVAALFGLRIRYRR
jgi:hypothetical protein